MRPRIALTVGDPAGIGPEVAAKAAADARVLEVVRADHLRAASVESFAPGVLSAAAGRAAYRPDRARGGRRDGRARRRCCDGARQQGGIRAGGPPVARAHRPARPPDRQPFRRDDVRRPRTARRARYRPHSARRGAAGAHARPDGPHDRADRPRAAAVRVRPAAHRGGGSQPACRRARPDGTRRRRGDRTGGCALQVRRHRRCRAAARRHGVCPGAPRRVRRRRSPAITIRAWCP